MTSKGLTEENWRDFRISKLVLTKPRPQSRKRLYINKYKPNRNESECNQIVAWLDLMN